MNENKAFGLKEYKEIHDLVYKYQDGSKEAAEALIFRFKTFLNKYCSLIKFGQYNLDHYSIRSFIKLFVAKPNDRSKINSYFANSAGRKSADEAVMRITGIFSSSSQEDTMQELYIIFFNMCSKYKDTKPSFHHYIKRNFHYYAYRHFEKITKDPIARGHIAYKATSSTIDFSKNLQEVEFAEILEDKSIEIEMDQLLEEVELYYNMKLSKTPTVKQKGISVYDNAFLNINWINGITCSNIFMVLTPFERKILVMWYVDNLTDTNIAEEFGVCRGTINKRRAIAKMKLKEAVIKNKNLKSEE